MEKGFASSEKCEDEPDFDYQKQSRDAIRIKRSHVPKIDKLENVGPIYFVHKAATKANLEYNNPL